MTLSFIAGIVFLALGITSLFAGILAVTFKDADKEKTLSIPYMILGIFTSLNYVIDFIRNLLEAPSNWREMRMELGLLGVGTAMSVTGLVLLIR
jgi:hypothetical protein